MANYEWISDFKMSMEAFRKDTSIYCLRIFKSGTNASMVTNIGANDPSISCPIYRIWNNKHILTFKVSILPYYLHMIRSFASCGNAFMVSKIRTKYLLTSCSVNRIWNNWQIFIFKVFRQSYWTHSHD